MVCCCGITHTNNLNTHSQCVVLQASSSKALSPKLAQTGSPTEWKVFNHPILWATFSFKPPQRYCRTSWSHAQMFVDPEGIELTYIANERMTRKSYSGNIRQWPSWIRAWSNLRNHVGGYDTCRHCYWSNPGGTQNSICCLLQTIDKYTDSILLTKWPIRVLTCRLSCLGINVKRTFV